MKRTTLTASLVCGLLIFSMLGCGGLSNHLQSITLTVPNGTALQGGVYNLKGAGSTMQLKATGNYSDSKTKDLSHVVTWNLIVDPSHQLSAFSTTVPLPAAPQTIQISATGLVTAVEPATCTWIDVAPLDQNGNPQPPVWLFVGAYEVTATFQGVTSQPIYIPIASSGGNTNDIFDGIIGNNPTQQCGP